MGGKVLFIDDDPISGKLINWAMEGLGHEIRVATDGEKALEEVRKGYIPNVVVCDICMPGIDGYETCRTMKQHPALTNTLFIAQTGWHTPERAKKSMEAGFDHHLIKPVDVNELLEILCLSMKGKAPEKKPKRGDRETVHYF